MPSSGVSQPNGASPDRLNRSRSRGRAGFVRSSAEQLPRQISRSSSRASFLGRPRQRVYQIYNENGASNSPQERSRSDSRTVGESLEDNDAFVFTDDDEANGSSAPTKVKGEGKAQKLASTAEEDSASRSEATTVTANSVPATAAPIDSNKVPHPSHLPTSDKHNSDQNKDKDVEAQNKHPPKPISRLSRIPYPIAHFLGHRSKSTEGRALVRPLEKLPRKIETLVWAWIGAMLGLGFVMITFSRWDQFAMSSNDPVTEWTTPIVIGSFGASSVILYGTPASPLGQPKAFVGGQFLSALVSVCITKLFELNHNYNPNLIDTPNSLVWIAGGIATGTALCVMILTDTVHPPGGATALLAATSPPVIKLGWHYLPVVLLSSVIMEVWAMLWMNLGRARYPHYWFWPLGHPYDQRDFRVKFPGFKKSKKNNISKRAKGARQSR
ncbi:uncharacterized protein MEPE_04161 [Melanopsichium pennsylvanicum]|uniref:HPP transmembrane region domain-containing protein n=2 Tax=Melanopsichium pennsylvanicum TaxID=63383 RepID=A0AAJ4XPD9_9BASI|nr:conserved hypothetical protein [Melanopsichium pennsylvanicum 4]SNX85452.1 uncharacterized protein MEPE_04161 [Melanopsichium pennsylvanicum]